MKKIFIYLQIEKSEILDVSKQLISKSIEITKDFDDFEVIGILISSEMIDENYLRQLGLNRVIQCITPNLREYSTIEYANIITEIINEEKPEIVLFGATNQGRDLAPRIAAKLRTGLTADCTQIEISEEGKLLATRPTFSGQLFAQILTKSCPQMATIRPNTFECTAHQPFGNFFSDIRQYDCVSKVSIIEKEPKTEDLYSFSDTDIIFSGGMGLKSKENFEKLEKLAEKFNAKIGASRKAVEKGLAEKKYQIGQTGQTVAPKIYVAVGISGAIQHISGIENSKIIIAVNPDKKAQIHNFADYSIYMDAQTFISKMLNQD